jgi:hypothetical protein
MILLLEEYPVAHYEIKLRHLFLLHDILDYLPMDSSKQELTLV